MHNIDILLATYNGARFLREQLDSLFTQTCQAFRIIARDDGSTDATPEILNEYAARYPGRIALVADAQRLGAWRNFAELMNHSSAPWVMFCDQDDVWLPRKIETELNLMTSLERSHGPDTPILVCTDLRVVDESLRTTIPSMWRNRKWWRTGFRLGPLLVMPKVTGCTVMVNRRLLDLVLPLPQSERIWHDWWLALAAASFGVLHPCFEQTVLYRQHGTNMIGGEPHRFRVPNPFNRLRHLGEDRVADHLDQNRYLAREFRARYAREMSPSAGRTFSTFEELPSLRGIRLVSAILRNRFFHPQLLYNIKLLLGI